MSNFTKRSLKKENKLLLFINYSIRKLVTINKNYQ